MTSKCIICNDEHERKWMNDEPAMYCFKCAKIKNDSEGVITQITPNIYLSGMEAAATFTKGTRICVHERTPIYPMVFGDRHIPLLAVRPKNGIERDGGLVDMGKLDLIMDIIGQHDFANVPILVHCVGGVERSPLVLAYYLTHRSLRYDTIHDAYDMLQAKRPVVSKRLFWLPQ